MLMKRAHVLLKDDRKDLRIPQDGRVAWEIKYKQRAGLARICNISASGMLLETDAEFDPKEECIFSFDSKLGEDNYIPQLGRLVWHRKNRLSLGRYKCGIKFLEADENVLTRMRARVQEGIQVFLKKRRTRTIVGSVFCAALIGLIGFLVWFSGDIYQNTVKANQNIIGVTGEQAALNQIYAARYKSGAQQLAQARNQLDISGRLIEENSAAIALFSRELDATRALLNQTETMLTQANDRNVELNNELAVYRGYGSVSSQNAGGIMSAENPESSDFRASIAEYRRRLRFIKEEIRRIKQQERASRIAAIIQLDRQWLLAGNNGYLIKDGQNIKAANGEYRELTADAPAESGNNVEIDVTFFE